MSPGAPWGGQWQYFPSACLQVLRMEHRSGSERQDAAGRFDQHAKMRHLERISESLLHRVLGLAGKVGPACFRVPGRNSLCPLPPFSRRSCLWPSCASAEAVAAAPSCQGTAPAEQLQRGAGGNTKESLLCFAQRQRRLSAPF